MPLETDLNVQPYLNDYDEEKNYHKILFKESNQLQSRELNQLQQILQGQIERFGETVLERGSIVQGGNFYDYKKLAYVKISDNNTNKQPIVIENYNGATLRGENSGVMAIVITNVSGYESKSPDLNTLYVRYTQTGQDAFGTDIKRFIPGETLIAYKNNERVPELDVNVATFGVDSNPLGDGYGVSCGEGILFQKGYFTQFGQQIVIVSKYNTNPHRVSVGFVTEETITNFNADVSLRDNAIGSRNFNAPGADRIKLTPTLVVYSKEQADEDDNFLPIQEYENGLLVSKRTGTSFSESLTKSISNRTYEESGNYTIIGHVPQIVSAPGSDNTPALVINPGVSYVNGRRVETIEKIYIDLNAVTDNDGNQIGQISTAMGGYVNCGVVLGNAALAESKALVNLRDAVQVNVNSPLGSVIGTANYIQYENVENGNKRLYLTNIRMNTGRSFSETRSLETPTFLANLILESGKAVYKEASKSSLLFRANASDISNITLPVSYQSYMTGLFTASGAGTISTTLQAGFSFPYENGATLSDAQLREITIIGETAPQTGTPTYGSVSSDGATLTLNVTQIYDAGAAVNALIPVVVTLNNIETKTLSTVYMKINPNGMANNTAFFLGWPDVHSIEGIWRGANTTFTENSTGLTNVTDKFVLDKNKTPTYYGTSLIRKKTGYTITNSDRFLVKAKVFRRVAPNLKTFSAITSYPINDTITTLPATSIRSNELDEDTRTSFDFRLYVSNAAAYSTTAGSATIATSASQLNGTTIENSMVLPKVNSTINLGFEYKFPRIDSLIINEKGNFSVRRGVPSENPKAPYVDGKNMVIANVYIPTGTLMMPNTAKRLGMDDKIITINSNMNRRYTMRDIDRINERVNNIEYYAILSALEMETENMVVKGADGLDRFKNGIFVDNFETMLTCDVKNPDFAASVDASDALLYPAFKAYNLDLEIDSFSSSIEVNTNGAASLKYRSVLLDQQPVATKFRNCVTDFYNFTGTGYIHPEYDFGYDETVAPTINKTIDMVGAFTEFTDRLNEFVPLKTSTSTTTNNSKVIDVKKNTNTTTSVSNTRSTSTTTVTSTTRTTTTTQNTAKTVTNTKELVNTGTKTTTQNVGSFITDVQFSPYLREQLLRVVFFGLRPNTRFWAWFDKQPVNEWCAPAIMEGDDITKVKRIGAFGSALRSDSNGELAIVFSIPKSKFFVGDREFIVIDVDAMNSADSATSRSLVTFRGFNYSIEKTGLEVSTRIPTFDVAKARSVSTSVTTSRNTTVNTTSTSTTRVIPVVDERAIWGGDGEGQDPISQTFTVPSTLTDYQNIMITHVEIPFKKKSNNRGITLQLRKTENGFPGSEVLAFGSVRVPSSSVSVSNDGSAYTTFKFKSPVSLSAGESYCIVLMPDANSPDYQVFCAKTGEIDLRTGNRVTFDIHSGTLFTSTNNMAWTPYQDENMAFKIYRAEYTEKNGTVNLRTKNYEFFNLTSHVGDFKRGETAFVINTFLEGSLTTTSGSNVVTASGIDLRNIFKAGDHVAIYNRTNDTHDVSRVSSVISATSMALDEYMTLDMTGRQFFKTLVGTVDYFNKKEPVRLFLKDSVAKSNMVFQAGQAIKGERSNAAAIIDEVISLPLSYYQADIPKLDLVNTSTKLDLIRQTNSSGSISSIQSSQLFGDNNRLSNMDTVIKSRSLELSQNNGARSFVLRTTLSLDGNSPYTVSPAIDHSISGITAYEYLINDYTDEVSESEHGEDGLSQSKYISKVINLREGFDAEDLNLWLTAYKPANTEINVYVKFISEIDNRAPTDIAWTKLVLQDSRSFRSSSTNTNDFKEYAYKIPVGGSESSIGAFIDEAGNFKYYNADGGLYDNYKQFIVKIIINSKGQNFIPTVKDVRAIALT